MVSLGCPVVLWMFFELSLGFRRGLFSGFPLVFLWLPLGVLWFSCVFSLVLLWVSFSYFFVFSSVFLWRSFGFPVPKCSPKVPQTSVKKRPKILPKCSQNGPKWAPKAYPNTPPEGEPLIPPSFSSLWAPKGSQMDPKSR